MTPPVRGGSPERCLLGGLFGQAERAQELPTQGRSPNSKTKPLMVSIQDGGGGEGSYWLVGSDSLLERVGFLG